MKRTTLFLATAALVMAASPLGAQRITVDLRAVGAAPTAKLANADLGTGFGLGGAVAYNLYQHLHAFGAWDYVHFAADQSFAGAKRDFEETGYSLGLRFEHPCMFNDRLTMRAEGAATYKHIEIEDDAGNLIDDSGHKWGFEAGISLLAPVGNWKLGPTVRYRALSQEFTISNVTTKGDLKYFALELGLSRKF